MPFEFTVIKAKHHHSGDNFPIDRVIIHRMETRKKGTTAENCARYFQDPRNRKGKQIEVSCHYLIDCDSVVKAVSEKDIAFHAPPNEHTIGLEHAGFTADDDWSSEYCVEMLKLSAQVCADVCFRNGIPVVWLSVEEVKAGARGITDHATVSLAHGLSTHTDPGPSFPREDYVRAVQVEIEKIKAGVGR